MWDQYRKTAKGMQLVIGVVTCSILIWSRIWGLAAVFFVTMQVAAVIGAMWAVRLKGKAHA